MHFYSTNPLHFLGVGHCKTDPVILRFLTEKIEAPRSPARFPSSAFIDRNPANPLQWINYRLLVVNNVVLRLPNLSQKEKDLRKKEISTVHPFRYSKHLSYHKWFSCGNSLFHCSDISKHIPKQCNHCFQVREYHAM